MHKKNTLPCWIGFREINYTKSFVNGPEEKDGCLRLTEFGNKDPFYTTKASDAETGEDWKQRQIEEI